MNNFDNGNQQGAIEWSWVDFSMGEDVRSESRLLQDETWKMPDGSIYQKYDYSGYMAEQSMWGHYGHGFGVWFMPVSREYYAGGPLRQICWCIRTRSS